ncbi:PREDICTED: uncharacterized protein LOC108745813 [Trachymyrmex septentrionalis]|uniref:uncharacterized protein LOC108745813 n=1 Tax=Trachymyrmex septentrionalis TaxID=34720 RepID=UPI00084F17D9|nr:PREDICTED: uncharacterized protein LOC108745813 [Trachymyrmex septentrionalis]
MAIWCFNKTIAYGTIASVAFLVYYITVLHNRKEKKEADKADHNKACEIEITNTSSLNIHNKRQISAKNTAAIPDNTTVISKVKQVVSSLPNINTSNPIKPPRNKKLYQISSKTVEDCNLIMQNNAR